VLRVTATQNPRTAEPAAPARPSESPPKNRFMRLLVLLLGMLVLAPLLHEVIDLLVVDDLFLTAVFIYAAYSFSRNKLLLSALIGLALPALFSTWAGGFVKTQWLTTLGGLCDAGFSATLAVAILLFVFREREVSWDVIAGAIVVYLLMAVMWSQVYFVLETLRPGSFSLAHEAGPATQAVFRYFSIVTITTVGYGDITPVTAAARAFANLEAIVGQLYLVILVAWLVGMHVSRRSK
jgi:hypothetical protein